jgi:hypothetical protein
MKSIIIICLTVVTLSSNNLYAQLLKQNNLGIYTKLSLNTAPFPHAKRENGYIYSNKNYSKENHYSDSSVYIFIPKNYQLSNKVDLVFYFHGWYNNIDSSLIQFNLLEQFSSANKNAIFVFPEGPKNSPDSYGGKLEEKEGFKNLVDDVLNFLLDNHIIVKKRIGNIVLSGHSGAYRVISYILMRGGYTETIKEVYLFDALYGQTEKFVHWIENYNGRLINIYTDDGGTKNETISLLDDLSGWNIPFLHKKELLVEESELLKNKLIFIQSDLTHNDVITKRNQFFLFLKTSCLQALE